MSETQAEVYGAADRVTSCGLPRDNRNHRKKQAIILEHTAADVGDAVLEVGCGHGLHAERYDDMYDYTGVDISPSLVDATQERIDVGQALVADARALPQPDDAVEAVVGTAVLHHLPDAEAALREWCRVARSSVTLMEPNYYWPLAFATAHLLPEERHKTQSAPHRLRRTLDQLCAGQNWSYTLAPRIYTLPAPASMRPVWDRLDALLCRAPGARWLSMMLLIHIEKRA